MNIIHGTWIPEAEDNFIQTGNFCLWIETFTGNSKEYHLKQKDLINFMKGTFGLSVDNRYLNKELVTHYFLLPTAKNKPLPSPELNRYVEMEMPKKATLKAWEIECYMVNDVIKTLNDIHFLVSYNSEDIQLGTDFLFWHQYSQSLKTVILKDQYIPALIYRELTKPTKRKSASIEIHSGWQIISEQYETNIQQAVETMPIACTVGSEDQTCYNKESLLRHFSEILVTNIIKQTKIPATFEKKIDKSLVYDCVHQIKTAENKITDSTLAEYKLWRGWQQKLLTANSNATFQLGFQLQEAEENKPDNWQLEFLAVSKQDPSLKLMLNDYWRQTQKNKKITHKHFGSNFEQILLTSLGYAARMYPKIWAGLETDKPTGLSLNLEEAFEFLKENAWVLEDANYKIIVPAWWTPEGRKRAKIKLKASSGGSSSSSKAKGYFELTKLIQYSYELSVAGQSVTEAEWQQLVNAKTPLVQFRGQWIELDRKKMQQMLEFWQQHSGETSEIALTDLLKQAIEQEDELEIEHDVALSKMLAKLYNNTELKPIANPRALKGKLRAYQKRGVAWLQYLEQLGLNGCLADDMGLGKTIQIIALLLIDGKSKGQTLLIAPTSVLSNWQREIEKFAPNLRVLVHHGGKRDSETKAFKTTIAKYDIIVTSFTLARKDAKLFNSLKWQRLVLDEAQNIKNPKTAQTKAILKIDSEHRHALTGTPVENRLLDLWSIFNFLNPGYLGKQTKFNKSFELPIQRDNDKVQSTILRKLVEPFILRRVKTDKSIIKDLPDKVEHKQYCNLTKEQASLYEAVVQDVAEQLEDAEGIQRKGLMLSTLMKLKQICNHPRQFLQDSSIFSPERSHKLERLTEMLEEVIAEQESVLIFTQFTEIGENLHQYLKHDLNYNSYYLHGGTTRKKREQMITEFQSEDSPPSIFVLSLKAGGVGITLTKANHVFHFDRWWNPAVEDQATDRAFRIGQRKNVFVHKFVSLGTLEERIDQMIEDKKKIASSIVGNDESWLAKLDNDSFKELIALNREEVME
ncbi:DEAD/DEAH box helicase [Candidatus Halobeggiatoa sp. HSG11]|nr:DEAD/DEAH box helicase [Candidatus Halobeggiatoa sp. HSG11]